MAGVKGRSGRPRKPTELHVLHGTDRPDRMNHDEPRPDLFVDVPRPPVDLDEAGTAEWDRIAPELVRLHLLSNLDLGALLGYCRAFSDAVAARKHVEKFGRYQKTEGGGFRMNPAVRDAHRAQEIMRAFIVEFGLSPASRSRVVVGGGGAVRRGDGKGETAPTRPVDRLGRAI